CTYARLPYNYSFPTRRSSDLRAPDRAHQRTHRALQGTQEGSSLAPWSAAHGEPPSQVARLPQGPQRRFLPLADRKARPAQVILRDRKSTRLNSSHVKISYAVF